MKLEPLSALLSLGESTQTRNLGGARAQGSLRLNEARADYEVRYGQEKK